MSIKQMGNSLQFSQKRKRRGGVHLLKTHLEHILNGHVGVTDAAFI